MYYKYIYIYLHTYIRTYTHIQREVGGAPMIQAPRNHFLVWIVKPSGRHCTDALGGKTYRRVPTPLRDFPLQGGSLYKGFPEKGSSMNKGLSSL